MQWNLDFLFFYIRVCSEVHASSSRVSSTANEYLKRLKFYFLMIKNMFVAISPSAKSNSVTGKLLLNSIWINWISGTIPVAVFPAENTGKEVKT